MKTALDKLFARSRGRISKSDLGEIDPLLKFLGHPERRFPAIHIAGTNGKGSCSHKLATGYTQAGYRVGLFTSPHVFDYNERIRINEEKLPYEKILPLLETLLEKFPKATFFEITTAIALKLFAEEIIDLAVIETGLGGKYDATNRVNSCCTLITSVGLEHQAILGNTLEKIAEAKLGILKEGVPFVIGPTVPTELPKIEGPFETFDEENNALCKEVFSLLQLKFPISDEHISCGLQASAPLRLQKIQEGNKTYFIDVAHNPPALKYLFKTLTKETPLSELYVLFALAQGVDPTLCEEEIPKECRRIQNFSEFNGSTLLIVGSFRHISEVLKASHLKKYLSI